MKIYTLYKNRILTLEEVEEIEYYESGEYEEDLRILVELEEAGLEEEF